MLPALSAHSPIAPHPATLFLLQGEGEVPFYDPEQMVYDAGEDNIPAPPPNRGGDDSDFDEAELEEPFEADPSTSGAVDGGGGDGGGGAGGRGNGGKGGRGRGKGGKGDKVEERKRKREDAVEREKARPAPARPVFFCV